MQIVPDGGGNIVAVARTDAMGCYYYNPTATSPQGNAGGIGAWQQLCTTTGLPAGDVAPNAGQGAFETAIAPSNPNIFYMMFNGYIFRSTNRGTTWTKTNFAQVFAPPNQGSQRQWGQKMAVDLADPNTVYAGTPFDGLFVTHDGGSTWSLVASVPAATSADNGIVGIMFDPTSGTNGSGYTNVIYAFSNGNGLYRSSNGSSFSAVSGSPTAGEFAAMDSAGKYYLVSNNIDLWRYSGGALSKIFTDASEGFHCVAVQPQNANYVAVISYGGNMSISIDGGGTFGGVYRSPAKWSLSATGIPWLVNGGFPTVSTIVFDPVTTGKMWIGMGIGMFYANMPANPVANGWVWQDVTVGIEELVSKSIVVPPSPGSGVPVLGSQDRATFYRDNLSVYPSSYGTVSQVFSGGWALDYAKNDPTYIFCLANDQNEQSGWSHDGGQTWTAFASTTPTAIGGTFGGTMAASTDQNIIWGTSGGFQPYYTANRGSSWSPLLLPNFVNDVAIVSGTYNNSTGVITLTLASSSSGQNGALVKLFNLTGTGGFASLNGNWTATSIVGTTMTLAGPAGAGASTITGGKASGWGSFYTAYYLNQIPVVAEPRATGKFYLYNNNSGSPGAGLYTSTDGAVTWTLTFSGEIQSFSSFNAQIKAIPGSGSGSISTLLFTRGTQGNGQTEDTGSHFLKSTDGGATWGDIAGGSPTVNSVQAFGFGGPGPSRSNSSIFIAGFVNHVWGVFRSLDDGLTWTLLANYPLNLLDSPQVLSGDPNDYRKVYVGFGGSGWAYGFFP